MIARERRYQIITTLPTPNGITSLQPAPAGPSAGKGPKPKISTWKRVFAFDEKG
jgi:hypothetical protein